MLAIMFRLGLGMAHAGVVQSIPIKSEDNQGPHISFYCGALGEQENLQLIDMLCPVCHALSCEDDLEEAARPDSRIFAVVPLFPKSDLFHSGSELPGAWSYIRARAPPFA